ALGQLGDNLRLQVQAVGFERKGSQQVGVISFYAAQDVRHIPVVQEKRHDAQQHAAICTGKVQAPVIVVDFLEAVGKVGAFDGARAEHHTKRGVDQGLDDIVNILSPILVVAGEEHYEIAASLLQSEAHGPTASKLSGKRKHSDVPHRARALDGGIGRSAIGNDDLLGEAVRLEVEGS